MTVAPHSDEPPSGEAETSRSPILPAHPGGGFGQRSASSREPLPLILQSASLLFANAETTERTLSAGNRVAEALGYRATVIPRWDELIVRLEDSAGAQHDVEQVAPAGIDMNKVLATEQTIDAMSDGRLQLEDARSAFARIAALPPVSLGRFALAAAVGASALSVIF